MENNFISTLCNLESFVSTFSVTGIKNIGRNYIILKIYNCFKIVKIMLLGKCNKIDENKGTFFFSHVKLQKSHLSFSLMSQANGNNQPPQIIMRFYECSMEHLIVRNFVNRLVTNHVKSCV